MGNIDKIKSTIKGWRLGDYFRQFSIVAAGIIVTFGEAIRLRSIVVKRGAGRDATGGGRIGV